MLKSYPKLNFPPIKLRAQRLPDNKGLSVWSQLRNSYIVLTPEEWVRRHLVNYLIQECNIPPQQMKEEYPVNLNQQPQRADLVVVTTNGEPYIVAECKAPDVKISSDVFAQAMRYNSVLCAKYIILTNGLKHLCFEFSNNEYIPLSSFPNFF